MILRGVAFVLGTVVLTLGVGCYETPKPACAFLCGTGGACPDGYSCSTDDNRCHLVEAGGALASCSDQLPADAMRIDANTIDDAPTIDASPIDAMPIDAMPIDAMPIDAMPIDAMPLDAMPLDAPPPDA